MNIRGKFVCQTKTETTWAHDVELTPVVGGSTENETYYKATPSGSLKLGGLKADVAAQFEVGRDYYLDITPAPSDDGDAG